MGIIKGFGHRLFFRLMAQGIPYGIKCVAEYTERRKKYLDENPHIANSYVLISCCSYCESLLKPRIDENQHWVDVFGGDYKESLYALIILRNAYVHNDGKISDNRNFQSKNRTEQFIYAKEILIDSNKYKGYFEAIDLESKIIILDGAPHFFSRLFTNVFKNSGDIVSEN